MRRDVSGSIGIGDLLLSFERGSIMGLIEFFTSYTYYLAYSTELNGAI